MKELRYKGRKEVVGGGKNLLALFIATLRQGEIQEGKLHILCRHFCYTYEAQVSASISFSKRVSGL